MYERWCRIIAVCIPVGLYVWLGLWLYFAAFCFLVLAPSRRVRLRKSLLLFLDKKVFPPMIMCKIFTTPYSQLKIGAIYLKFSEWQRARYWARY